jgi:thioredoxin reductase (NADPH)
MSESNHYDVIIVGSGIAGLSAAIYAARGGNNPLIVRGDEPGGQLTLTSEVANYPGFPDTVGGTELIQKMEKQAEKFGTEFERGIISEIDTDERPFLLKTKNSDEYLADSVISASGASARTLGVPGEDELMGYGVSTCATCDGAFFKGEDMIVVGGGDAAFEEAVFLTKYASKVYVVHRREGLRAEEYLQEQVDEKIKSGDIELLLNTEVVEIEGSKEEGVDYAKLVTNPNGYPSDKVNEDETEHWKLDAGAVFMAIGHTPNTQYLNDTEVDLRDSGYINVEGGVGGGATETDVEGIFAAGDVVDHHYQQAATASGMGVKAAMDVNEYLERLE